MLTTENEYGEVGGRPDELLLDLSHAPLRMPTIRPRRVRLHRPVLFAVTLPPLTVCIPDQPLSVAVQVAQGEDAGWEV